MFIGIIKWELSGEGINTYAADTLAELKKELVREVFDSIEDYPDLTVAIFENVEFKPVEIDIRFLGESIKTIGGTGLEV